MHTPEAYAARFAELMTSDFAWVHLAFCGLLEGNGLVLVEYPKQPAARRGGVPVPTSLNFSGPERRVADADWDASVSVTLEPG